MFQITSPDTVTTTLRGTEYTVTRRPDGTFRVYVVNAMVRAYRRGYAIGKDFATLAEVEAAYKGLRGVSGAFQFYRIRSTYNCNSLAGYWSTSEEAALAQFHAEMAPTVLDVYARAEAV